MLSASTEMVVCQAFHLTAFGSDFFVPPNTIDFSAAYSDLGSKLAENNAVLIMLSVTLVAYIIIGIWARRMDRKDILKVLRSFCSKVTNPTFSGVCPPFQII